MGTDTPETKASLDQLRSRHALERVRKHGQELDPQAFQDYISKARSFPAMVQRLGLGQALGAVVSATKDSHKRIYNDVQEWLCGTHDLSEDGIFEQTDSRFPALDAISKSTQQQYITAQAEVMAYSRWLKWFASARKDQQ